MTNADERVSRRRHGHCWLVLGAVLLWGAPNVEAGPITAAGRAPDTATGEARALAAYANAARGPVAPDVAPSGEKAPTDLGHLLARRLSTAAELTDPRSYRLSGARRATSPSVTPPRGAGLQRLRVKRYFRALLGSLPGSTAGGMARAGRSSGSASPLQALLSYRSQGRAAALSRTGFDFGRQMLRSLRKTLAKPPRSTAPHAAAPTRNPWGAGGLGAWSGRSLAGGSGFSSARSGPGPIPGGAASPHPGAGADYEESAPISTPEFAWRITRILLSSPWTYVALGIFGLGYLFAAMLRRAI